MTAIAGTRRAMKEMADGTIRVQVDIDPAFRRQFLDQFPNIDMPVALAPLVNDFEQRAPEQDATTEKLKGGVLANLAGRLCKDPVFINWLGVSTSEDAAQCIRANCTITSRAELDHDERAAKIFHKSYRIPFHDYVTRLGLER